MPVCLVIDDSPAVRKIVRTLLEKYTDYSVIEANNGREGYDYCIENVPDRIFVDNNMPVMNGLDFLKAFANITEEGQAHIVYSCRELDGDEIRRAMNQGASDYIIKPFDHKKLFQKMKIVSKETTA